MKNLDPCVGAIITRSDSKSPWPILCCLVVVDNGQSQDLHISLVMLNDAKHTKPQALRVFLPNETRQIETARWQNRLIKQVTNGLADFDQGNFAMGALIDWMPHAGNVWQGRDMPRDLALTSVATEKTECYQGSTSVNIDTSKQLSLLWQGSFQVENQFVQGPGAELLTIWGPSTLMGEIRQANAEVYNQLCDMKPEVQAYPITLFVHNPGYNYDTLSWNPQDWQKPLITDFAIPDRGKPWIIRFSPPFDRRVTDGNWLLQIKRN